jgi:hypothetical protein
MARRKKTTKKTTRRRRSRVSGIGAVKGIGTMLTNAALATGGYVAATMLGRFVPGSNNLVKGGAKIAAGVATGTFIKGNAGQALALGMAIAGVVDVTKQFAPNLISGIGEEPVLLISGVEDISSLGEIDSLGEMDALGEMDSLGSIATLGGLEG